MELIKRIEWEETYIEHFPSKYNPTVKKYKVSTTQKASLSVHESSSNALGIHMKYEHIFIHNQTFLST